MAIDRYDLRPAPKSAAAASWPSTGISTLDQTHPTLIMVLNPQCPCSRASLAELAELIAHSRGRFSAQILVVAPAGATDAWIHGDLWKQATQIPDAVVAIDRDGREANALGATTSGEALLYSASGQLLFSGGITDGRGHQGDNSGYDAIFAIVHHANPTTRSTPVFGCALMGPMDPPSRQRGF